MMLAMKAASVEAAFGKLGEGIERQWRTLDYDQNAFNAIAVEMLASAGIVGSIGSEDILDWAMTSRQLPAQHDLAATFGQPPLTMYRTERFHVSVLFWLSATVSIHEHGFEGAFAVLDGSSIHSSWTFEQTLSISTNLKLGTVRRNSTELLEIGAIRPILAGPSGAHSLVHLDTPSATVVIRTCADPRHHLQYNYLVPGVAINPEYPDQTLVKKCQLIKLIASHYPDRLGALIDASLAGADALSELELLSAAITTGACRRWFPSDNAAVPVPAASAPWIQSVVDERRRESMLMSLRSRSQDPAHRLALAIIMNHLDAPTAIELFARKGFADPVARMASAITELLAKGPFKEVEDPPTPTLLHDVISRLIDGWSLDQIRSSFADKASGTTTDQELLTLAEILRRSTFLADLIPADQLISHQRCVGPTSSVFDH
ncbi:hypothetical protein [Mycobacterium kansasii]|uniref:hypothetical protein n=1 Tax=Mycobacterium kansasii TaxID=1768 RepID=UPI000CDDC38B|nr:hypothetical protein [Mycobacterium kansasii]POX89662.1 hypothetical protein C3B43_10050 [Mycobacterium kansasii]POY15996.1 hypothetical protein C3476_23715 [Mycobacterium kansasii]